MFDFIYYNFNIIFAVIVFIIGAIAIGADIQTFAEKREQQRKRSASAIKGWATRRAKVQG